jgi:hypothetical protein
MCHQHRSHHDHINPYFPHISHAVQFSVLALTNQGDIQDFLGVNTTIPSDDRQGYDWVQCNGAFVNSGARTIGVHLCLRDLVFSFQLTVNHVTNVHAFMPVLFCFASCVPSCMPALFRPTGGVLCVCPGSHRVGARGVSIRLPPAGINPLRYVNITAYGVILRLERTIKRAGYS